MDIELYKKFSETGPKQWIQFPINELKTFIDEATKYEETYQKFLVGTPCEFKLKEVLSTFKSGLPDYNYRKGGESLPVYEVKIGDDHRDVSIRTTPNFEGETYIQWIDRGKLKGTATLILPNGERWFIRQHDEWKDPDYWWLTLSQKQDGPTVSKVQKLMKNVKNIYKGLHGEKPTHAVAISSGVKDQTYSTVRYGKIGSYSGEAIVTMANGDTWKCIGHKSRGTPEILYHAGWIEYIKL